ncbi:hypothetical protein AL062_26775 [Pseudomonas syringae pv. syringae]|nr:hypothetical protein AL062_26775 [Pseudomonas syringae pv. syringae]KWS23723.1 hypothetical protein AL061_21910 [Pseudomonas syringae pv. syringae]
MQLAITQEVTWADEKEGEVKKKVHCFHTDQIGTQLEMTHAKGQIVWRCGVINWPYKGNILPAITVKSWHTKL